MNEELENCLEENCLDEVTEDFLNEIELLKYKPLDEIIEKYPNGVTINGCLAITKDGKTTPAVTFAEEPGSYFYAASGDFGKLFNRWVEYCCGEESTVNRFLAEKPQYLRFYKVKNKSNGGKYVKVEKGIKDE